ncbi:MAG: asparaginase [Planctomycetota bacterium]
MREMKNTSTACALLANVSRSGRVESQHFGAAVVVTRTGRQQSWGDTTASVYTRSAIKPLQALPLVELGIAARLGLEPAALALACASHAGTAAHVAAVERFLAAAGFGEADLQCGPHAPFDRDSRLAMARAGARPRRIHNNCSGKHTGFLLVARELGVPLERYLDPDAASQRVIRDTVAAMADVSPATVAAGVDGCGAPTLRLSLEALAAAFCRFANPDDVPDVRAGACRSLSDAMIREPMLLCGEGTLTTELVRAGGGAVLPKNGAEGVYAVGVRGPGDRGCGIAVKVADGQGRGYEPVIVELLRRHGVWDAVPPALASFARPTVRNTLGAVVGHVECALEAGAR